MISRSYDKNGRLLKVTDSQGACMEYRYDTSGRRTAERSRIRDGVYQEQRYTYTATGRLASVLVNADAKTKTVGSIRAVTSYRYDRNGNLTRIVTPLGHEIRREYDRAGKLVREAHIQKDGKIHHTVCYLYDDSGRLCETGRKGERHFYGYDCRGRRNLVRVFFVKYFSLKTASEFPVFIKGFSLLLAGTDYASRRMRACSIR